MPESEYRKFIRFQPVQPASHNKRKYFSQHLSMARQDLCHVINKNFGSSHYIQLCSQENLLMAFS